MSGNGRCLYLARNVSIGSTFAAHGGNECGGKDEHQHAPGHAGSWRVEGLHVLQKRTNRMACDGGAGDTGDESERHHRCGLVHDQTARLEQLCALVPRPLNDVRSLATRLQASTQRCIPPEAPQATRVQHRSRSIEASCPSMNAVPADESKSQLQNGDKSSKRVLNLYRRASVCRAEQHRRYLDTSLLELRGRTVGESRPVHVC
jgi:hypothetical protein